MKKSHLFKKIGTNILNALEGIRRPGGALGLGGTGGPWIQSTVSESMNTGFVDAAALLSYCYSIF